MRRGGVESNVFSRREREGFAWLAEETIRAWEDRRRLAIANCDRDGIILAKWRLRRAKRLLERIRPSRKPCRLCSERAGFEVWYPIEQFYRHGRTGKHDKDCAGCRRLESKLRYRGGALCKA